MLAHRPSRTRERFIQDLILSMTKLIGTKRWDGTIYTSVSIVQDAYRIVEEIDKRDCEEKSM